jgi:hypothetical protein
MLPKRVFYIVGISFMFFGGIITLNSAQGITGFAVFAGETDIGYGYIVGIWLFVAGVAMLMAGKGWDAYRVKLVVKEYESGNLNPVQAITKINDELHPSGIEITGIDYRGGNRETFRTKNQNIPVELKNKDKARDLALAAYEMAVINDRANSRNCELHINKNASSKHHKDGLMKLIHKFEDEYKDDLETARTH